MIPFVWSHFDCKLKCKFCKYFILPGMNNDTVNFLELNPLERKRLRAAKIRVKEIHYHPVNDLQTILEISKIRAMELFALSEFQSIPSIGIRFAYDLISMGYYSLDDLKGEDGAKLTDRFERQTCAWVDPCVEDQFRLVVHRAQDPNTSKKWWDFTAERKRFRAANGYPADRPEKPWFELPQYSAQRLSAAK